MYQVTAFPPGLLGMPGTGVQAGYAASTVLFPVGEARRVVCGVEGFPVDKSTAEVAFRICNSRTDCKEWKPLPLDGDMKSTDGNVNGNIHYNYTFTAITNSSLSGEFRCQACTSENDIYLTQRTCDEAILPYFLTDKHTGFDIIRYPPADVTLIAEDEVTLECSASIFNFSEVGWFQEDRDGEWKELDLGNGSYTKQSTGLSYIATIHFKKVELQQDGQYHCQAKSLKRPQFSDIKTHHMVVLEILPPEKDYKRGFNMNDTELFVYKREVVG